MNFDDPHDMAGLAGEYVLGTLSDAEMADVAREMRRNGALRAEVAAWQDRLLGMAKRATPIEPPDGLWARIDAALPSNIAASTSTPTPIPIPIPLPTANAPAPAPASVSSRNLGSTTGRPAANEPVWRRAGLWQALSGMAIAACLVLATLLVMDRSGLSRSPDRYIAVLQSPDRVAGWVVEISAAEPLKLRPLTPDTTVPEGKSLQFWTKIDGAAGPTSLGLVHAGQPLEVELAKLPGVAGNQLFEITLEPPNGSPLNKPTGPVLFIGRSVKV